MNDDLNDQRNAGFNNDFEQQQQELARLTRLLLDNAVHLENNLKESAKTVRKEMELAAKTLDQSTEKLETKIVSQLTALEKIVTSLVDETFILKKLPQKTADRLTDLVPDIAAAIGQKTLDELKTGINNCHKQVDQLNNQIQLTSKKLLENSQASLKKRLAQLALTIVVTACLSTVLAYLVMQSVPKIVTIDTKGDITIDGGHVSIWGTKTPVQQKKGGFK